MDSQSKLREQLKQFLQVRRRDVQALTREPTEIISVAGRQAAQLQQAYSTYNTQQDAIQRDFDLLLRTYRDANTAIRATEPPAYFSEIPTIKAQVDQATMTTVLSRLAGVSQAGTTLRDTYQEPLNRKLNDLQRDAATLLDTTFAAFVRSVEQDAEAEINKATVTVQRASSSGQLNAL
jgi:hypothetical protein